MTRFAVTETEWSGVPALRLTDAQAETAAILVPSLGGNLISLTDRGRELLRTAPDSQSLAERPARWGVPVLMPPNRIAGGRFRFGGREYHLDLNDSAGPNHIHGFPLRRAWSVASKGTEGGATATIRFTAAEYPDVMRQFPHPFVLELTYSLVGKSLRCSPVIKNHGQDAMPFGLGFHPYLLAPEGQQIDIRLTPGRIWEAENWLPTGEFRTAEGYYDLSSWQPVHAVKRGEGYALTGAEPDGWSRFELANRTTGLNVSLRVAPAYRHWLIFNGFEGTVSPEPYTCMTNTFNLDLDPAVSGMDVVAGGEELAVGDWELNWSM